MKLFLIIWGIFVSLRWWQLRQDQKQCYRNGDSRLQAFVTPLWSRKEAPTSASWGKKCLHIPFTHVLWFDEDKEKYSPCEISNEGTNTEFSHPSYSRERNFQLLGKSRKNIWRGSKPAFPFLGVCRSSPQSRRLQSRKPQGAAHGTVFLWETETPPWLEHSQPNKAQHTRNPYLCKGMQEQTMH